MRKNFSRRPPVNDDAIIEWRKPARFTVEEITVRARALLPPTVSEAYVFGSYARGTAHADSDLDLLIVAETQSSWPQRALEFSALTDYFEPVDLLVYTPEEWARMRAAPSPFLQEAASEWVRVR
jgi:predicted nucleotidyltransferase